MEIDSQRSISNEKTYQTNALWLTNS